MTADNLFKLNHTLQSISYVTYSLPLIIDGCGLGE